VFLLGILSGLGVSLQLLYSFALFSFVFFVAVVGDIKNITQPKILREKFIILAIFFIGAAIGDLPMVLFDIRHNFYHLKTGFNYFSQVMLSGQGESLKYYHFLYLWIVFALFGGWLLYKLFKKNYLYGLLFITVYLIISFSSYNINFDKAVGMPEGLTAADIYAASSTIANESDKCERFNVLETLNFDKRAHVIRYPLIFKYNKTPLDVTEYKKPDCVFSLSQSGYDFENSDVWEVNEMKPIITKKIADFGYGYSLYKLTHE
jgi:hypothetical protein